MIKRFIAGATALALVFGTAGIAGDSFIGESVAVTASAAEAIDFDEKIDMLEIAKGMTHDELIQFIFDNNIVSSWNAASDIWNENEGIEDGYFFNFYWVRFSNVGDTEYTYRLIHYVELSEDEYIWYVVVDGEVYIADYVGDNSKDEFITPATINGMKVAGYAESYLDGIIHADHYANSAGFSNRAFGSSGVKNVYIPKTVTYICDYPFWAWEIYEDYQPDRTILVNADSYALEYCIEQNLKYEIVPDDYAVLPDIGEEDTTPDDKPTTDDPTDKPTTDDPTDNPSNDDPADKPSTDDPTDKPTTDNPTDEGSGNGAENADGSTAGDESPATGAAAIAFAGLALAGAAIAITKKNK